MKPLETCFFAFTFCCANNAMAQAKPEPPKAAAVSSIQSSELTNFDAYPETMRALIEKALTLTRLNLTYTFASDDPTKGGMDCSGSIYHVLQARGFTEAPRQSDELCLWIKGMGNLHLTPTATSLDHDEFNALRPGDLLFWAGTYASERKLPVTHVMLYLGKLKSNGHPVIFGSSDGRRFAGQSRCGVSVFDFDLPKPGGKSEFYGYGAFIEPAKAEVKKP